MDKHITGKQITAFEHQLRLEEREPATIEKYLRDIRAFTVWLGGGTLDKEAAVAWKGHLLASSYAPSTINSMLIAVNRFFRFQGWNELRVKTMRIQRRILITKVYMPKYIYPLTRVMSSMVNLVISLIPMLIVCLITGVEFHKSAVLVLFFLICLTVFSLGLGLLLSAAMVFFRDGNLVFVSRKDYQVKHGGRRIELGEIETAFQAVDGVKAVCCVQDRREDKLVLYYIGKISERDLPLAVHSRLPKYMIPAVYHQMESLPLLPNGKLDRKQMDRWANE